MRQRAMRSVTVRFSHDVPREELERLAGVQDVDVGRDQATFNVVGEIDDVVKALGQFQVLDLTIAPADLEEIFLRFYDGGSDGS